MAWTDVADVSIGGPTKASTMNGVIGDVEFRRNATTGDFTSLVVDTASDGSAASPFFKRNATNDGFFFASGVVGLAIGGTEKGRFTSTGLNNCAIGATTTSTIAGTTGTFSGAISASNFAGTTYSPTYAGVANVTGTPVVAVNPRYIRVGNVCFVSVGITISVTTGNVATTASFTLPVNSNNGAISGNGVFYYDDTTQGVVRVLTDAGNPMKARAYFYPSQNGNQTIYCECSYEIV